MSLSRLAQLAVSSQHQGYALFALQHLLPAAAGVQQRLYQAAVNASAEDAASSSHYVSSSTQQQSRTPRPPQQEWLPTRSLPPTTHYGVKVTIKAHDLIFVKMASTVIRDLMLVNFAPKSQTVLPPDWRKKGSGAPHVNLVLPIGDAAPPTKRKHWTVIRGPHVHKTSREQFARTTHQRVVSYATNNVSELNWFLDSLKMYKFIGVELVVRVTSSSYLLPTTAAQQAAAEQPLLQAHMQRFSHLFGAAAPTGSKQQQQLEGDNSSSSAAVQQSLQGLRDSMHQALLKQRLKLSTADSRYQRWRETSEGSQAAAAAAALAPTQAAAAANLPNRVLEDAVLQQLAGSSSSSMVAEGAGTEGQQQQEGRQQQQQQEAAAFLAAIDKALLQLKLDVIDRHKFFPYLMAFYQPGKQQLPAAEWMHAMLKYGKMRQAEVESSQAAEAVQAYQQYGQVNQTLLLMLLQQWHQAANEASRKELVMPKADRVEDMLH